MSECYHPQVPRPTFDLAVAEAENLSAREVRKRWPRAEGPCPDCGARFIGYASKMHYYWGDW